MKLLESMRLTVTFDYIDEHGFLGLLAILFVPEGGCVSLEALEWWGDDREDPGRLLERWGRAEIAEELGINISNVDSVANLPRPVQEIKASRLWLADEIREFAVGYRARRQRRQERRLSPL